MNSLEGPLLFPISPGRGELPPLMDALPELARGGVRHFLLREKTCAPAVRAALARALAPRCRELGVDLWISEDWELAAAAGAAGVHLSERSPSPLALRARLPPHLRLGVSLHRPLSRSREEIAACSHAFLSPVFPGEKGAAALGIAGFLELARAVPVPCVALGGITARDVPELARAGVRRIAGIRLFFSGEEPERDCRRFLEQLHE